MREPRRSFAFPNVVTPEIAARLAKLGIDADESFAGFLAQILSTDPDSMRVASLIVEGVRDRAVEEQAMKNQNRGRGVEVDW